MRRCLLPVSVFAVLTFALSWPLSRHPASSVLWVGGDTELFMWTLAWNAHAFVTSPLSIFNANIFAPNDLTLAYSEHLIGSAIFAAPVLWLTGNPVLALNFASLVTVFLCGTGAYFLARRLGVGRAGAVIAGIVFAFAPPRFFRLGQLHLTSVQWIPFGLAFLHTYFDARRRRDLWLAAACFTLQVLSSGHGTIFLATAMAALVVWRSVTGTPVHPVRTARDFGLVGLAILLPVAGVILPYRLIQDEVGLRRSLVDWVVSGESWIASPSRLHAWLLARMGLAHVNQTASAFLFPGLLPLVLAVAAWFLRAPGVRPGSDQGQTGVRPGSDGGQTGVRPGSDPPPPTGLRWASQGPRRPALRLLAATLAVTCVLSVLLAIYVSLVAPVRFRIGGVLFSARDAWRPWMYAVIAAVARLALARWYPLDPKAKRLRAAFTRWRARAGTSPVGFYSALTILCVLLSIGPPFGIWPLVYWLPGLNFVRVPSRFIILAVLGLAILAGVTVDRIRHRFTGRGGALLTAGLGVALLVELAVVPLQTVHYEYSVPAVDKWLARQPGDVTIAEFPAAGTPGALPAARQQTVYMLHSTVHWKKTIHGYSGVEPPDHTRLYGQLRGFPDDASIDALEQWNVQFVVVHPDLYPRGEWPQADERIKRQRRLTLVHVDGTGRVYSLNAQSE